MIVAALIGAAAVAHATWNIVLKRAGSSGVVFLWLSFAAGTIVYAPFGVASLVAERVDLLPWAGFAVVSGAMQIGYFLLLQRAYRAADVSVVYPLARGTGPLLSVVLAILLLGERPALTTLAGAAVVIAGVVVIGLAGRRTTGAPRVGILYGLGVGVVIAVYTLWDATAVTTGGMPPIGLYAGSVAFQLLLLAPLALRQRADLRPTWTTHRVAIVTVGVLAPLAYMLVLIAMQQAPVSVVAPAREVSVVLVGLAGWLLFREPHPLQRLIGAAIVLAGVGLLSL